MKLRLKYNAPVILTFALICTVVLVISEMDGYRIASEWFVTRRGSFLEPRTWITMVTYVFGHSGIDHFMSNMMLLLLTGPVVEEKYGSLSTAVIMLVTAVVTALANMIVTPNGLIGCSGIVFAFIILCSMTSFSRGEIPLTMVLVIVLYLGSEIVSGFTAQDDVSHMAHILGGIAGAVFGYALNNGQGSLHFPKK
ncbi:rhomboid family intramembrane serine protease [Allobaculum mucilyticum]|uniref:rhomboid family intramembrane serine protease n=1 Tax=Allobaculum mucilyticum TaxID=2834459 RepID=UPI001E55C4A8|nr:rhomboid family intramembrane serine protease [Allobaculum mucilyticum]UNT96360.1 rhomboid family intramembrane serine protease [Allobaculum mucilyticum]